MSCVQQIDTSYSILCAAICAKPNDKPIAKFSFDSFFLIDGSSFFDDGTIPSSRQINWKIYVGDYLVYDFGWGYYNDLIPDIGNGSLYSIFDLGEDNQDIIGFIETLPSVNITNKIVFKMIMYVSDNTGRESEISQNTYLFSKII